MKLTKTSIGIKVVAILVFGAVWMAACTGSPSNGNPPGAEATRIFESALLTATYSFVTPTNTLTPSPIPPTGTPTETPPPPTQTPDPNRTPPALPSAYQSSLLNPIDTPHTYIQDTCQYLKMRWDPNNSAPGTVVMPIMFHSITDGDVTYLDQVSVDFFNELMRNLESQGFKAITAEQLAGFLERNEKIPSRSVMLIVDDRKRAEYFETHFKPYYESLGWIVNNAWISAPDTPDYLWQENAALEAQGWVNHQAHGVIHNIPMGNDSSDDYIRSELNGSIEAIQQRFGKTPIAIIWPGGGFAQRPVELAREAGYKLGFTVNPRGPLMFNWIPLADQDDPGRPSFMPEGAMNDPLMVLPRYWDTDASYHIDNVRIIGKEAAAEAQANKAVELEYYDIVCQSITGPIPTAAP